MISIVIPLYNKEQSITKTLDSVFAQTYADYECIIVNDGSTDQSAKVVEEWINNVNYPKSSVNCHKYPSFRLINKENGGVSSARNKGVEEAKEEYVAFLDGDDLWAPTYLEELARLIEDYPDKGLYSIGYKEVYKNEVNGEWLKANGDGEKWVRGIVENPWNDKFRIWTGSSSSSRALLMELGGFDMRMTHGEDIDLWWRLLLAKGGAQYAKPLSYYVQDSENRAMHKVIPLEKHIPYYIEKFNDERLANSEFRKYFDTQMIYRLYPYLFTKQYRKEAQRLAKMLDYSQLKWSMHFRMQWPYLYRWYELLKGKKV